MNITETLARFDKEFNERSLGDEWEYIKPELKTFIQSALEQNYQLGKQDGAKEVIDETKRMKLWNKGNVEGTRQDILYRLSTKFLKQ